jgi:hypothetical protein
MGLWVDEPVWYFEYINIVKIVLLVFNFFKLCIIVAS